MKIQITSLFIKFTVVALLVALIGSAVQVTPVYAASINVNTNTDTQANDGKCTLREAIIAANINARSGSLAGECLAGSSGADSIGFAGNYTITIGSQLPFVTTTMTITGRGAVNTIIQAAATPNTATWRIFQVTSTGNLTLDGVTVRNGRCNGSCTTVGDVFPDSGAGIFNDGTLTVTNSIISGNTGDAGAGIMNFSTLTVTNSTFSANNANGENGLGGAIYSDDTLTVTSSTFLSNLAVYGGGGIFADFILNVKNSTFSSNSVSAGTGGGIYNTGLFNLTNSTFAGNTASDSGGGLYNYIGTPTVTNSTFAGNLSASGGGVVNYGGTVILKNTILANNSGGNCAHVFEAITDGGYNLESGSSCGFNINNNSLSLIDPLLGPLANNGGPTQTMAIMSGSIARDNGYDVFCSASPVNGVDQRGVTRPQGAFCDIGAYEYNGTFSDAPLNYWAWDFIERLYNAGITGGCSTSPLQYCPDSTVTRAQMAIFLERGIHGSSYNPPAVGGSTGFNDVPLAYWAGAWIKQLAADGITGGCGSGSYCPEGAVTRAQMAIFLLRSKHGAGYNPPAVGAGTGFSDVSPSYWAAAWIKQLVAEGITAGCGTGIYCPEAPVTRAQMAVFLVRTFNLP
jgi:CSLREA domain-containing protein